MIIKSDSSFVKLTFIFVSSALLWWVCAELIPHVDEDTSYFVLFAKYVPVGLLSLAISLSMLWFVLNLVLPTIDKYLDEGLFKKDWVVCSANTRVITVVFGALFLLWIISSALKP